MAQLGTASQGITSTPGVSAGAVRNAKHRGTYLIRQCTQRVVGWKP